MLEALLLQCTHAKTQNLAQPGTCDPLCRLSQNKPYMLYVGREILHQASLHHPFIVQVCPAGKGSCGVAVLI
jgi:hypothetical protein